MSNFQILKDVENRNATRNHNRSRKVVKKHVAEKKNGAITHENRGVLQPMNNGTRQGSKRLKLSKEEEIEKVICLDDSLKENVDVANVYEEILNIEKAENEAKKKEEISETLFPKILLNVADYRQDIWRHLQEFEQSYPHPRNKYMLKQTDLNWNTRSILVDWLSSVAEEYSLCNETFHLSINYIDRFLRNYAVAKGKFQLVGAAAMLLAGKIEEIYPINLTEWCYLTGDAFTTRHIKQMEQLLVKSLKFRMQAPTMCTFIEHFCQEHNLDSKTTNLAMYISELVLLEGDEYLNHLPSKLAASSIAFARHTLAQDCLWPKTFQEHSGYSVQQLSPVLQKQQQTFKDSPLKSQQAIQTKYKSDKYQQVALLKPRKLTLEDFEDV